MKPIYIFIGIVGMFVLGLLFIFSTRSIKQGTTVLSPTPIPLPITEKQVLQKDKVFNDYIDKRPSLSSADESAKTALIKSLKPNQETIYSNNEFVISYASLPDQFQVEILSTNYQKAEDDAINWFATKGIDKNGVCKLPVMFYPSLPLRQALETANEDLPTQAIGC